MSDKFSKIVVVFKRVYESVYNRYNSFTFLRVFVIYAGESRY